MRGLRSESAGSAAVVLIDCQCIHFLIGQQIASFTGHAVVDDPESQDVLNVASGLIEGNGFNPYIEWKLAAIF